MSRAIEPEKIVDSGAREAAQAVSRSWLYRMLGKCFEFPSAPVYQWLTGDEFAADFKELLAAISFAALPAADLMMRGVTAAGEIGQIEFEAAYIRLFELGRGGRPPCPLYEGEYSGDAKMRVMEDLVRCYEYFGFGLQQGSEFELPDHLCVQLEFMHCLALMEAHALEQHLDPTPYRKAQQEFLQRHLSNWLEALKSKLTANQPPPFFDAAIDLVREYAALDEQHLGALIAEPAGNGTA